MPEHPRTQDPFGPNAWLVDDMYEQYRQDPSSVSDSWQEFFEGYRPGGANLTRLTPADTASADVEASANSGGATTTVVVPGWGGPVPSNKTTPSEHNGVSTGPRANGDSHIDVHEAVPSNGLPEAGTDGAAGQQLAPPGPSKPVGTPIRGAAARVVANMSASLEVPTATSFRVVPARLLEVNRRILNNQLSRSGTAGKVSFTHLIGYAVVEALRNVTVLNSTFVAAPSDDPKAPATVVHHERLGLGIAVDTQKSDGTRMLMVPVIKEADTLSFRGFWGAYEDLIRKVRTAKVGADDFAGATVSLTNPGTIGTVQSVPRLMPGQGAIVGVGTIDYPAEWQAADPRVLAELGVSKVVTLTSTYDHRIIQGAESGLFLQKVHHLLTGGDGFYERIFRDMGVPYEAVVYHPDVNDPATPSSHLEKQIEVDKLINIYRVRGHLIAHLDPLDWKTPHMHAELDPATYGLTVWDLEREFVAHELGDGDHMKLSEILGLLRDAYCRTVGVEYMHISEPTQKRWIQQQVEGVSTQLEPEEHRWILGRLNAAEALEQFLNTKYIGQKRFGLEGGEAAIPLVDSVLDAAATAGQEQAVIGMAHRGRLNVLINIVGKT
ncbi:MAG: 2-oxo acid dehydrogenase subunit E2, partial [Actinomycetota bacterium]|nr:2-oxo acid dehydrogenase subunit E2 [Actinomycetota bacterium]